MTTASAPHPFKPPFPEWIAAQDPGSPATILDCSPEPLLLIDDTARIRMLNRAAILSYAIEAEKAVGRSCAALCFQGSEQIFQSNFDICLQTATPITWDRKKTTPPCCLEEVTLLPLTPIADTEPGIIVHIRDFTREEKINELMEEADRLATLNRLANGISHQMRNPLSAIMLFTDILADEKRFTRSEQELELFADIKDNIRTVTDIITRVLGFTGQDASPALSVDINAMIRDILQLWSPIIKRNSIRVDVSLQPDLGCVTGDRVELGQAVGSLVRNAIEAMKGGGTLTLTTARAQSAQNEERALITCTDTGPGIDVELKKSIFDPFFSDKQTNSGIGLSVARRIAGRYGGMLSCLASAPGKTIFSIELPLAPEPRTNEISS